MNVENRPEERAELESRAHWALEHPAQLEPREVVDRLRLMVLLWHYPAFEQYKVWAIFAPARGPLSAETDMLVRKVVWDSPHDLSRFANPLEWLKQGYRTPPSIYVSDTKIAYSQLALLLDELAKLPVPVAGIQPRWGLDGETFGFAYGDSPFLRIRLEWWGDGPTEWQAFTDCVTRLLDRLQQSVSGESHEA